MTDDAADPGRRWSREWAAIGVGTGLLVAVVALGAAGRGVRVLPEEVVGRGDDAGAVWLVLGIVAVVALGPAIAYLSRRPAWPLVGLGALAVAVAATALLGNALPAVFTSATVSATFLLGVLGAIALRPHHPAELAARAVAVIVLVGVSWLLSRRGAFDPLPLLVFAALGVADAAGAAATRAPHAHA